MCDPQQVEKTDADLIRSLQAGEIGAFDEFFARHRRRILAYAIGLLNDRALAEDVVQETFVAFVKHLEHIEPERGAVTWLFRVARNRAIDVMRKRRHEFLTEEAHVHADKEPAMPTALPDSALLRNETRDEVLDAVRALPDRERDVLLLHYFGELKFREVAKTLKRPLGTVLWQARRGVTQLRSTIGHLDPTSDARKGR